MRRYGENVNSKAVLRIMRRYGMLARVRRAKAYTRFKNAVHTYPSLLKRAFE